MSAQPDTRLVSKQVAFSEIPIVNISPLVDGTDPDGVAERIGRACEEVGFSYITNHGVAEDLVERMYRATESFLDLPLEASNV